ncbi:hypothetical protein CHS0354_004771 [Potamilus streckersoni]|uniref:Cilia- and flagella-associated protein 54 n=1 Tax=Potamilus streckersoni TaxID=2493646 RepID=A0AAE0WB50_9BIVA|nr:hypothetical protein CHS0354_004771 [Potamilus streckersoni]
MASILRSAAAAVANRGHSSSFYNKDKANPVLQSLNQELKLFMGYMKKRITQSIKPSDEANSRPADTLFEIWNRYEPCLPKIYYQEKLLEIGDFLVSIQEYRLALWQCYDRYLMHFGNFNVDEITDVDSFKRVFFPSGFDGDSAGLTFRALMGKCISTYEVNRVQDPKLQNKQSSARCVQILSFLRLVMQIVLPKENLCWLVYNGTIHIYSISRYLMSLGYSAKVLEYLLWASMCMETSVPLLAVKYLSWRVTLYTAVCQCYYDCKAAEEAESFARRGLSKISELSQLEVMSSAKDSPEREAAFRQATVKMAIMVFKRSAFETRRRPKGILRPKTRANLKEAQNLDWPRTPSEKLLADMFEGSAAQFLCILESLNDTNRRILLTAPPAPESDVEILDVYAELFMAGQEMLAGGGGVRGPAPKPPSNEGLPALAGVVKGRSLIDMATRGEDGATIDGAIRLTKYAFGYEQWEVFDSLVENVLAYLRVINEEKYLWDEKVLQILMAMEKILMSRKQKKTATGTEEEKDPLPTEQEAGVVPSVQAQSVRSTVHVGDELIHLADVLMSVVTGPFKVDMIEKDIVVDASLYLWSKCKTVFQKYQTGSLDNPRYLQKMENPNKWVYILDVVHQSLCWCGIGSVDPALTAEVVLRLGLVLEASAQLDFEDARSAGREGSLSDTGGPPDSQQFMSRTSMLSSSLLNINPRNQLFQAREILELGLQNVSFARQAVSLSDGKSIADISWAKDLNEEIFSAEPQKNMAEVTEETLVNRDELLPESLRGTATAVWNTIKDLHQELILMYHRVCLKLEAMGPDPASNMPEPFKRRTCSKMEFTSDRSLVDTYIENFEELLGRCNKNLLSRALLYMQKASLLPSDGSSTKAQKKLLENSVTCIQKAQSEEKRTYMDNVNISDGEVQPSKTPPSPILLSRTDTSMTFKPVAFKPASGEQVAWYRLFGRSAVGSNVKARLNDYFFPGTGEEVPYYCPELKVSGLKPNERYIFAVAAYTADGKLIGNCIGESTKPILAIHPLSVLTTWAFLSHIAYQIGSYDIARQACDVLWNHFIAESPPPEGITYRTTKEEDFKLTLTRLNQRIVCLTSPVLLRQFLTSVFINVDISIRRGELFCDVLCDKGPYYSRQIDRLVQCEKLMVAIELAGWLNESNLALQAVVQCYGLLSPLIFYKIPSVPVIQVLQRCHAVLLEIPTSLRQKRQASIADSLHHMTACITYHLAKVLRSWGQKSLANNLNEAGRHLLALESGEGVKEPKEDGSDLLHIPESTEAVGPTMAADIGTTGSINLQSLKSRKKGKKSVVGGLKDHEADVPVNEELKALETHMLILSKQAQNEHELTGSEDPNILHAYIAYLPSRIAFKEVAKFRKRARYLEFIVQVAQKALTEGLPDQALEWCEDAVGWLVRRNEQIIGVRAFMTKQPGGTIIVSGDDPKKFAAAMVEYSREKEFSSPRGGTKVPPKAVQQQEKPAKPRRRLKYKPLHVNANMSEAARQAQEVAEVKAVTKIGNHLPDLYHGWQRKKRLRKVCIDEMHSRIQLNIIQGLSCFSLFLQKLENKETMTGQADQRYSTNFLDPEWFTFETAGTLVMTWESATSRQSIGISESQHQERKDRKNDDKTKLDEIGDSERQQTQLSRKKVITAEALDLAGLKERTRTSTSGIEIAAALTTGVPPPPLFAMPLEAEDTPRTYRSDVTTSRGQGKQKTQDISSQSQEENIHLTSSDTVEYIKKTFAYLQRAIVLAHRGQHWTLLQNATCALWNCTHTALLQATTSTQTAPDDGLITVSELHGLACKPFHIAADCVLDMMTQLQVELEHQSQKAKNKGKNLGEHFESWYGTVTEEIGGASLKFENPLDDQTLTDLRWVRRLVMRVMEILYFEEKWEKLVDIGLRFNALSDERYAEQIIPLLVQSQRRLTDLIHELGGHEPPQPHFQKLMQQLGGVITAKKYLHAQLTIAIDKAKLPKVALGAGIDPMGHGLYSSEDSVKNVSVPLDIPNSLATLYDAFEKAHYTSRALHHSRKLMVLYLASQQNGVDGLSRQPSRVEFIPNTGRPQPTMPPDISQEQYFDPSDVVTTSIPKSQIGIVLSSYEKTIEMLLAKNQRDLAAQAMHELGNLHFHTGSIRASYKWWADALDLILDCEDALHTWRKSFGQSADISSHLLDRCGLWGCLLSAVITSKIAQYILTSDLGMRMECCFLSGYLFKSVFRSSLPHPHADQEYALYDVGEGCEVTNLVPGIDLLSDRFRCDGRQLVASLRWVSEELARGRHGLFVLPLLTLYLYFTTYVCRDVQRSVDGRILKVRVLTDLGLYSEAVIVLQRLLHGERLPHMGDTSFRQVESKASHFKFDTSRPVTEPCNLKILEMLLDKRLSSSLGLLYGPHLTCQLSLTQAHLFTAIAETIPVLPVVEDVVLPDGQTVMRQITMTSNVQIPKITQPEKKAGTKATGTKSSPKKHGTSAAPEPEKEIKLEGEGSESIMGFMEKRFTHAKKPLTLEFIKGTLLVIADQIVTTISDSIQENEEMEKGDLSQMAAAELELLLLCRLEQATIAHLKHHAPMAARIVLSTLKLFKNSSIFKKKKEVPPPHRPSSFKGSGKSHSSHQPIVKLVMPDENRYQYQNFQSRSRLDARLWLDCRLALVKSLMMETRGMGEVKGSDNKVLQELADCRQYCAEGLGEAEACGHVEMQAEFLFQGACLNIIEGKSLQHTVSLLQDAIKLLLKVPKLSIPGEQMLASAIILCTDLEAIWREEDNMIFTEKTIDQYLQAQTIILKQMQDLGETIEHYYPENHKLPFSAPVSPMKNIYLPHCQRLAQIKLRVGHAMSRSAAKYIRTGSDHLPLTLWSEVLGVLTTALEISQASVMREVALEAEILLNMGKVQRMLVYLGKYQARNAADTLLRAIKTSHASDHNLGLMRQAYLEIALVYLYSSGMAVMKEGMAIEIIQDSGDESATVVTASKDFKKKYKTKKERIKAKSKEDLNEQDRERRAAFLAIRCAAAVANSQRKRHLLTGDVSVTTQKLTEKAQEEIPEFLALDLVNPYVLGKKKKVYKNEIEEELAPMMEAQEIKHVEKYDEQIQRCKETAMDLSWIHFLGYQSILQRLCSTSTISASSAKSVEHKNKQIGDLGPDFDLGFISHAQCDIFLNHDVVKSMLFSSIWLLRLQKMHVYLAKNLQAYGAECVAVYPPADLELTLISPVATELSLITKSYKANFTNPADLEGEMFHLAVALIPGEVPPAPGIVNDPIKPSDKAVTSPSDVEVTLQWYQPSLEETDPSRHDTTGLETYVLLLYAVYSNKSTGPGAFQPRLLWVSLSQLHELHDKLAVLSQRAEIYLGEKVKKEPITPSPTTNSKSKKTQRIKPLSSKDQNQKDEQLEILLRQCVDDIGNLFGALVEQEPGTIPEIPFEVKKSNIEILENLFDPSFGATVKGTALATWLINMLG